MVTAIPDPAAVPASPMNIGAPILLAYIEAPICQRHTRQVMIQRFIP